MLKLIFVVFTLPLLLQMKHKNLWALMTSVLFMTCVMMLVYLPSGLNLFYSNLSFFFFDGLCVPLIILTLWISGLMVMASYKIFLGGDSSKFFILSVVFLNNLLVICFMSENLLLFYVMFEASLVPTMMLILGWGYQPERLQASSYFVIYTVTASLPLLVSLMLIYSENLSLSMILVSWDSPVLNSVGGLWWVMTILAFLVKLPLYSSHLWLPKAHVEAPVAGSMILAAVLLKLGGYGLMRVTSLFPELSLKVVPVLGSLCMVGACVTSAICLRQPDMKSMIAYSSVGHMGFVIIGVMSFSSLGWSGALSLMVAHGLCSSALFSIANMVYESVGTRSLFLVKGLMSVFPCMSLWWFLLSVANMSGPPSFNLFSEILLLGAILKSSFWFSILFVISSFLVGAFSLFLFVATQHGGLSNFLGPFSYNTVRHHMIMVLHVIPIYFLILHPFGFFYCV